MDAQAISLRAAPGSDDDGLWSGPISAGLCGGAVQHLAIPYRVAAPPDNDPVHGTRVPRKLQQSLGCEDDTPYQHFHHTRDVVSFTM